MDVFEIDDLRKYIFSFLRKEPKLVCNDCNKVLIWDKKVNEFIRYENICINEEYELLLSHIKDGNYCMNCHLKRFIYHNN